MPSKTVEVTEQDLGIKTDCPTCNKRFYNLKKLEVTCPYCEHSFTIQAILKSRKKKETTEQNEKTSDADTDTNLTSLDEVDNDKKAAKSNKHVGLDDEDDLDDVELDNVEADVDDNDLDDDLDDVTVITDNENNDVSDIIGETESKNNEESN